MKKMIIFLCCLISFTSYAQDHEMKMHTLLNDTNFIWKEGPASLPEGSQIAVLEGDLSKEGPFTIRLMLPANYKVYPHFHPAIEHISVFEGAFHMGSGKTFDEAKTTRLGVGGFGVMPIGHAHFAFTKEKTIIQLHGIGPWGITYVDPKTDPRNIK